MEYTNPNGKHLSVNTPRPLRVAGHGGLRGGWASAGRVGPTGPDSREGFKNRIDFKFQRNLELGDTLRNFTRRFRIYLDMRIFPKFF
jgi:hypothetical protein